MISDQDVDEFLEHYGVKGMKWGIRNDRRSGGSGTRYEKFRDRRRGTKTARVQKRVDRTQRIATGKASAKDRALGSAITKKGAQRQLQRGANAAAKWEAKTSAGKARVRNTLLNKSTAVRIVDLNWHVKGDANAKLDNGQKAAVGFLAAIGALQVASVINK